MTLTIELPEAVVEALRAAGKTDVAAYARESMLVELYRRDIISHKQLADALGLDRWQTEDVLHEHQVGEDLPTFEELQKQVEFLQSLPRKVAP